MIISTGLGERLREERERTGLNQTDFGVRAGVSRGTQKAYEQGTSSPDVRYLAALQTIDVDVHYVLIGARSESSLSALEQQLLQLFRGSPFALQAAAIGALEAGLKADRGVIVQGDVSGQVAGGDITNQGAVKVGK